MANFLVSLAVGVSSVDMEEGFDRVRNLVVHGSFVAPTDCVYIGVKLKLVFVLFPGS